MSERAAHILILEDDDGLLALASRVLTRRSYRVTAVADSQAARLAVDAEQPDVLIVDYNLQSPDTGLDFFRSLRAAGLQTPAIMVSGVSDELRIIEALRAGVADVLPKTSDYLDHLPEAVARVLETQRAARRQADSVTRLKDEFLATLSHELRTPLNAIVGWTQYLLNDHSDADRLVKGLQVIERNARLQAQMVEDLLDMSRMLAGKLRLETRPMDLASVAEEAIAAVRPAAEARQIELHPALGQGGVILGDPARLQQVVWNLLMNAIKFTPRQGRVSLSLRQHDDTVALEVSDNGRGIKGEFLGSVFDRFTQEDVSTGSTGSTASGLGLGLAIARHLVELHGGQIRAASAGPGMGAAFTVTLPLAAAGSGASASETPPA